MPHRLVFYMLTILILLIAYTSLIRSEPLIITDDCEENCSKLKEDLGEIGCSSICEATTLEECSENCDTEVKEANVDHESARGACGILCNRFQDQTTPESNTDE